MGNYTIPVQAGKKDVEYTNRTKTGVAKSTEPLKNGICTCFMLSMKVFIKYQLTSVLADS